MAVEARHMSLFPPQLITNSRDFIKANQGSGNIYNNNTQLEGCVPLVDTMQEASQLFPLYQSIVCDPNMSAKTSINKADSGLTYNMNIPVSAPRKRPRDSFIDGFDSYGAPVSQKNRFSGVSSVLDDDVFSQIQQQQQEIDRFIAEHTEKVRLEFEERRKRQSRMLIAAIQEGVMKKMKEKDEEIQRMGKLNWVLQERVKSLYVENQLWRDLAQTNEATANSLRTNLEQVLAHVSEERHVSGGGAAAAAAAAALADDAESSCGSSDDGWRKVVVPPQQPQGSGGAAPDKEVVVVVGNNNNSHSNTNNNNNRKCRKCGEKESSVLLLPCRHLCLCTMCGSTLVGTCPACDSITNASVHVNMS